MEEGLAATFGATSMVLFTQPIDTIKVNHQQLVGSSSTPLRTALSYVRKTSLSALWAGLTPSLSAYVVEHAILFGCYGSLKQQVYPNSNGSPFGLGLICGASTLVSSLAMCPLDALKCNMQVTGVSLRTLIQSNGIWWMWSNYTNIVARDSVFFSFYVGVNAALCKHWLASKTSSKHYCDLTLVERFLFGGVSGAVAWTAASPFDVVNSRRQAQVLNSTKKKSYSFVSELLTTVRVEGILTLYRGYSLSVLRGFFGYGMFTLVYELSLKSLKPSLNW